MISVKSCLIDTPLLVRLANTGDILYPVALNAIAELHSREVKLHISPQNLIEFRNVATRSINENGLGYSSDQAEEKAEGFEELFILLNDITSIFEAWKSLVHQAKIVGKQVHDARLAAFCQVHQIDCVLTFNQRHFVRFLPFIQNWTVLDPHTI